MNFEAFIASVIVIYLPLGFLIPETFYKCWTVTWVYVNWVVYVCNVDEHTEFYKIHEIFHKIWNEEMTQEERNKYIALYKEHKKLWVNAFFREYWLNSVEEDFADNWAIMIQKKRVNPVIMKRIRLIKSLLK